MTTIKIDRAQALSLLQQAVDAKGTDYVYQEIPKPGTTRAPGCWYESNGAPSCGVGQALFLGGVPLQVLADMDNAAEDSSIGAMDTLLAANGVELTPDALVVFSVFQSYQDLVNSWGYSLGRAKEAVQS